MEPRSIFASPTRSESDEELALVRVGPRVGHGQDSSAGVSQVRLEFVFECFAPKRLAALAGPERIAA